MTPDEAAIRIRRTKDPTGKTTMRTVKKVWRVFDPDRAGLREVLYVDNDDEPLTAWLRGDDVLYVDSSW